MCASSQQLLSFVGLALSIIRLVRLLTYAPPHTSSQQSSIAITHSRRYGLQVAFVSTAWYRDGFPGNIESRGPALGCIDRRDIRWLFSILPAGAVRLQSDCGCLSRFDYTGAHRDASVAGGQTRTTPFRTPTAAAYIAAQNLT